MAYSTSANAGFRISGVTHGATSILGNIRCMLEKIIDREVIQADAENTPTARPVNSIDARVVCDFLDASGGISHTATAANITASYTEAGGSAASVIIGTMLAGSVTHNMGRNQGGFGVSQEFQLQGTLTYTPTA